MRSTQSHIRRRIPQQERSEQRVAELLAAAAAVIAAVGYEAATMTAIAERAGASIGAVYQYFPNKDAIAWALKEQYARELEANLVFLDEVAGEFSVDQLVDKLLDAMVRFMDKHPDYLVLMDARVPFRRDPQARNHLRERLAGHLRQKKPSLAAADALRLANVALQVVKSLRPLYAPAKPKERLELASEFKLLLTAYLHVKLGR